MLWTTHGALGDSRSAHTTAGCAGAAPGASVISCMAPSIDSIVDMHASPSTSPVAGLSGGCPSACATTRCCSSASVPPMSSTIVP
eukprot:539492-Prymnesium_polylepis.1